MAIIQISKIQQRSGNLVDLPQLDEAEFGWASDTKRLFIGKSVPNENVEVLTSYSNISFSQVTGAGGSNLNITAPLNGQVLSYVASTNTWQNSGSTGGGLINLGTVANVKMSGGAIGYVLQTDGTGNLTWASKGTITANIVALSNATPIIMKVATSIPYTNGTAITISGVNGVANSNVNSKIFYVKVATDFPTSGNVSLYTDSVLATAAVGTSLTYTNNPNAIAVTSVGGGGATSANGSTYSVQFNNSGIISGDSNITWDFNNRILSVNGNTNVTGNLNVTANIVGSRLVSTIATGTTPLVVTSTTRVANLNAATSGVANTVNDAAQPSITSVGTLTSLSVTGNISGGNISAAAGVFTNVSGNGSTLSSITGANVSGAVSFATTANSVAGGNVSGQVAYAATANSIAGANVSGAVSFATTANSIAGANVSGQVANALIAGTVYTAAQPNITRVGLLTGLTIGNATANSIFGNGTITLNAGLITGNGSGLSAIAGSNVTGIVANATYATSSGTAGSATTAGTVTTAAQPNITSTGTLTGLTLAGTLTTLDITTGANTTAGTITGNWTLSSGSRMQATYADLAEYYEADFKYLAGTVLEFGGDKEVTLASDGTARVAGVVSTNPAYAMNATCPGIAVEIALQGRVPTKVRGKVRKGDMMISAGDGYARPSLTPQMGTVIGKALENFDGIEGVIEVAVGRL